MSGPLVETDGRMRSTGLVAKPDGCSQRHSVLLANVNTTRHGPVEPDDFRNRSTSDCALILLRQLAKEPNLLNTNTIMVTAKQAYASNNEPDVPHLLDRLSDSWAWLVSRGFIGPSSTQGGGDWRRLTTRGQQVAAQEDALTIIVAEDRLALNLHPILESKIRPIFALGDFETAAFAALKAIEVRVRDLSGAADSALGVSLMRNAFKKDGGVLIDHHADPGEQVATMELFAGAIGTFKNPASHRTVDYADPTEAAEVVLLADLLMRLLDRVERRRRKTSNADTQAN